MSFSDLGLAEPLVRAIEAKGYTQPTPIQRDSIPTLLDGRDLLGIAQTGTGKTAAFVLPSIQRLVGSGKRVLPTHVRMLVLAPTRELAMQVGEAFFRYGKEADLNRIAFEHGDLLQTLQSGDPEAIMGALERHITTRTPAP